MDSSSLQLLAAIALPNVGGIVIGVLFSPQNTDWYENLKKPSWNPPGWLFAPAWTILYTSMGYASYIVWKDGGGFEGAKLALVLYGVQLVINWAWTIMFFGLQSTQLGLVNFSVLIPTAIACTFEFFKVNDIAGGLLVPYILWLGFACFLNYTIHTLNQKSEKKHR